MLFFLICNFFFFFASLNSALGHSDVWFECTIFGHAQSCLILRQLQLNWTISFYFPTSRYWNERKAFQHRSASNQRPISFHLIQCKSDTFFFCNGHSNLRVCEKQQVQQRIRLKKKCNNFNNKCAILHLFIT